MYHEYPNGKPIGYNFYYCHARKQARAIPMMMIHINTPSYEFHLMLIDFNEKETHPGN